MNRYQGHRRNIPGVRTLVAVLTLVMLTGGCSQRLPTPNAIPAATVAAYPGNDPPPLLVDASWLQSRLESGGELVVLDASELRRYRAGHIPGAIHAWWQDTMDPNGSVYGTVLKPDTNIPDPQKLRRHFIEDLGITPDTDVVVYDDERGKWAARIVWTLRFLGYARAAVLDGGLAAWQGAGGDLQSGEVSSPEISNPPISPQRGWYLVTAELLQRLREPGLVVLDVRTDAERSDDLDGTIEPGTIPGAASVPWTDALADDHGHLLPPSQLRHVFERAGVTPDQTVVLLARFGVETAHSWLVLKLLGYPNVLILDGGWVGWAASPDTPKQHLNGGQ